MIDPGILENFEEYGKLTVSVHRFVGTWEYRTLETYPCTSAEIAINDEEEKSSSFYPLKNFRSIMTPEIVSKFLCVKDDLQIFGNSFEEGFFSEIIVNFRSCTQSDNVANGCKS